MFRKDLSDSAKAFIDLVWPIIKPHFNNCEIRPVETVTTIPFYKELDQYSGIDAWVLNRKKGMRGLASRVQWPNENWSKKRVSDFLTFPWNTFTIRRSRASGVLTEFSKRLFAIKNEWLYPYFTVQAYVSKRGNKGELLSVAWCRTIDLIYYIKEGIPKEDFTIEKVNKNGSATFYAVLWENFYQIYPLEKWDKNRGYIKFTIKTSSFNLINSNPLESKKLSDFF